MFTKKRSTHIPSYTEKELDDISKKIGVTEEDDFIMVLSKIARLALDEKDNVSAGVVFATIFIGLDKLDDETYCKVRQIFAESYKTHVHNQTVSYIPGH